MTPPHPPPYPRAQEGGCGRILYPGDNDNLFTGGRPLGVTLGVIDSLPDARTAAHQGTLRLARVLKQPLSEEQVFIFWGAVRRGAVDRIG